MMSRLRWTLFGGIVPRLADRGLPDNAAQFAMNAKLTSGELRAWSKLRELATLSTSNAQTVYHYVHGTTDRYLAFTVPTNVVKAPLLNEQLGRIYYTNSFGVSVTSEARILASQAAFRLGVPPPTGTFTVVPSGGTAETAETRVYVVTLATAWGEESAPMGSSVTVTGNADGTWTVNGLNALAIDTANYPNITHMRLYRTLTSQTGVDYRLVNEWTIGSRPAAYVDNVDATDLAAKTLLQSLGWGLPPIGLMGLVGVAGGFLAGFKGRTVYLSVPYQPHAWPADFQFAVEDEIVALGVVGSTVVVATIGQPYLLVGPVPEAMSLVKMDGVQPCLQARSLVNTVAGVMYASPDGLVLIDGSSNQAQIISKAWVTKTEWLERFSPDSIKASVYQDRYFAFYSSQLGFAVGFDDPVSGFTELQQDGVLAVDFDPITAQTMIAIGNKLYEWDGDPTGSLTYAWRSKPMLTPKPCNFGALQLRGTFIGEGNSIPIPPAQGIGGYAMNEQGINAGKTGLTPYGGSMNGVPFWMALGISPSSGGPQAGVVVKVYLDGVLIWTDTVNSEEPRRLPSGRKGVQHEIEIEGVFPIYSATLAETFKALEDMP